MNRLTEEKDPGGIETGHSYDAAGRRLSVSALTAATYYAYDAAHRMQHAKSGLAAMGTAYYEFDAAARLTKKTLGNAYFGYDAAGRTTSIKNCLADGSPLCYFSYEYDAASRITSIIRENDDIIYYGYDAADRLTAETWKDSGDSTIYAFAWDYDAVGNRTWQNRNSAQSYYEHDAANALARKHALTGDAWTYYSYDARGNCEYIQESDGTTYFEYSDMNLITSVKEKDASMNYFWYDAQQRRYAIQDSDGLAYFTYDRDGLCTILERDASGSVVAEHARGYAPTPGIGDMAAARINKSGVTYYQYRAYDNRGNTVRIVDENGAVTGSFEYDAHGRLLRDEPPVEGTRFNFSGPAWIKIGTRYITPTRVYEPDMGRFLQRDPSAQRRARLNVSRKLLSRREILTRARFSLYQFAQGNPMSVVDPSGEDDLRHRADNRKILQYMPETPWPFCVDEPEYAQDVGIILKVDGYEIVIFKGQPGHPSWVPHWEFPGPSIIGIKRSTGRDVSDEVYRLYKKAQSAPAALMGGQHPADYYKYRVTAASCAGSLAMQIAAEKKCFDSIGIHAGTLKTGRIIFTSLEGGVSGVCIAVGATNFYNPLGWVAFALAAGLLVKTVLDFKMIGRMIGAAEIAQLRYCNCKKIIR